MADAHSESGTQSGLIGRSILLMLTANLLFSFVDSSTKWLLLAGLSALQIAFMRYAVHFAITIADMGRTGFRGLSMPRGRLGLVVLRAMLLVTSTVVNFLALQYLPLSVTAAMMFTAPIIVCMLSGPLLGERVGLWRWSAILFGFCGVVMIVQPFGDDFSWPALMMLYPATGLALYSILTRKLVHDVSSGVMQFSLGAAGTLALAPFAFSTWVAPESTFQTLLLCLLGIFAWAGHEILIRAHRYAPASVVMPYTYSYLIYLTILGYLVFSEIPDTRTIIGGLIIVGSGLTIWMRERATAE